MGPLAQGVHHTFSAQFRSAAYLEGPEKGPRGLFEAVAEVDRKVTQSSACAGHGDGLEVLHAVLALYDGVGVRRNWDLSVAQRQAVADFARWARQSHTMEAGHAPEQGKEDESSDSESGWQGESAACSSEEARRAEKAAIAQRVLEARTHRVVLVLEHISDLSNRHAIFRSCDAFGIQDVWLVNPPVTKLKGPTGRGRAKVSKRAHRWLSLRHFTTTAECLEALRAEACVIWGTTLRPGAKSLDLSGILHGEDPGGLMGIVPTRDTRLAVVMGSEGYGLSDEMAAGLDLAISIPMLGFSESLNVSVATALVLQAVLALVGPQGRTALPPKRRKAIQEEWTERLVQKKGELQKKTEEGDEVTGIETMSTCS